MYWILSDNAEQLRFSSKQLKSSIVAKGRLRCQEHHMFIAKQLFIWFDPSDIVCNSN